MGSCSSNSGNEKARERGEAEASSASCSPQISYLSVLSRKRFIQIDEGNKKSEYREKKRTFEGKEETSSRGHGQDRDGTYFTTIEPCDEQVPLKLSNYKNNEEREYSESQRSMLTDKMSVCVFFFWGGG